jgi:hypothetical protein
MSQLEIFMSVRHIHLHAPDTVPIRLVNLDVTRDIGPYNDDGNGYNLSVFNPNNHHQTAGHRTTETAISLKTLP